MFGEELERTLQEVSADIDKLSKSDKPLTKEEKRYHKKLLMRKSVLSQIKEAKEKKQKEAEIYHSTMYELLVPWGEKHPLLMFIMMNMMRVRWGAGSFLRF